MKETEFVVRVAIIHIRERCTLDNVVSGVVKYRLARENFSKRTLNRPRPVLHERDGVSSYAKDMRCAIKMSLLTER